jgi:hypothetical protein
VPRLTPEEAAIRRDHLLVALKPFAMGGWGTEKKSIAGRWQAKCRCGRFFGPTTSKKRALELHLEHVEHETGNMPPWVRP